MFGDNYEAQSRDLRELNWKLKEMNDKLEALDRHVDRKMFIPDDLLHRALKDGSVKIPVSYGISDGEEKKIMLKLELEDVAE